MSENVQQPTPSSTLPTHSTRPILSSIVRGVDALFFYFFARICSVVHAICVRFCLVDCGRAATQQCPRTQSVKSTRTDTRRQKFQIVLTATEEEK